MSENSNLVADALLKTNPGLYGMVDGGNSWKATISQRGARVRLYRDYERGDHRADLTTQMRKMLRIQVGDAGLSEFNDNYCSTVVDKMASRLSISDISTGNDAIDDSWLQPMLDRQDFQAAQGKWWNGAICEGDSYVMIDPVTLLWSSEPAYDGFSGMVVIFNNLTRRPQWACKIWSEADSEEGNEKNAGQSMRLVVYEPKRITYWKGFEGGGEVSADREETPWPVEFSGAMPFVVFSNNQKNYTCFGESEIRKAIPLQDVLNRTLYSMVAASEFSAFGINWSIGMKIDPLGIVPGGIINMILTNSDGTPVVDITPEQIEFLKSCKVGQFPATDISQYTNQLQTIVKEISQATQTPIYGITTSGVLSGEALKQLETGLIGKIERFQNQNTDSVKELIVMTSLMERVFAPSRNAPKLQTVHLVWKPAELLDVDAQISNLIKMRKDSQGLWSDDFYRRRIGSLMGMSKSDIAIESKAAEEEKLKNLDILAGYRLGEVSDMTEEDLITKVEPAEKRGKENQ